MVPYHTSYGNIVHRIMAIENHLCKKENYEMYSPCKRMQVSRFFRYMKRRNANKKGGAFTLGRVCDGNETLERRLPHSTTYNNRRTVPCCSMFFLLYLPCFAPWPSRSRFLSISMSCWNNDSPQNIAPCLERPLLLDSFGCYKKSVQ